MLAVAIVAVSMTVLLVAQLTAAGLVTARLLDIDFGVGIAGAAATALLALLPAQGADRAVPGPQVCSFR